MLGAADRTGVDRLIFLGSSCIYPRLAEQPIREDSLFTGALEPTNDAYAIAKIAGILQIQALRRQHGVSFISAMPTKLYGPGDNFDLAASHVMPAMIRKVHEARQSGAPSVSSPSWSPRPLGTTARWTGTAVSPTARRGSCWTPRATSPGLGWAIKIRSGERFGGEWVNPITDPPDPPSDSGGNYKASPVLRRRSGG